jgi:hypothetical protein
MGVKKARDQRALEWKGGLRNLDVGQGRLGSGGGLCCQRDSRDQRE